MTKKRNAPPPTTRRGKHQNTKQVQKYVVYRIPGSECWFQCPAEEFLSKIHPLPSTFISTHGAKLLRHVFSVVNDAIQYAYSFIYGYMLGLPYVYLANTDNLRKLTLALRLWLTNDQDNNPVFELESFVVGEFKKQTSTLQKLLEYPREPLCTDTEAYFPITRSPLYTAARLALLVPTPVKPSVLAWLLLNTQPLFYYFWAAAAYQGVEVEKVYKSKLGKKVFSEEELWYTLLKSTKRLWGVLHETLEVIGYPSAQSIRKVVERYELLDSSPRKASLESLARGYIGLFFLFSHFMLELLPSRLVKEINKYEQLLQRAGLIVRKTGK
ncbi:MAG: hypothetical protein N2663_03415 [Chlorobi bacterium]|nr:hypothetical protein [Chlorobiota bacterium]